MQEPGSLVGRYVIEDEVGHGAAGVVYRALDPATDRHVAVKVLPAEMVVDRHALARFRREVRAVARLEHARIVPIYDVGDVDGQPYMVMRLLPGDLAQLRRAGAVTFRQVQRFVLDVGSALDFAHAHGVLHRDVKPSNVLIDEQGRFVLSDFGLARFVDSRTMLTAPGTAVGSPFYMSPEQACGEKVDARSDLFSLGCVLYELLAGRPPFAGKTYLETMRRLLDEDPVDPCEMNPALPRAIGRVALRSVEKDATRRYQSCEQLTRALAYAIRRAEVQHDPVTGHPLPERHQQSSSLSPGATTREP